MKTLEIKALKYNELSSDAQTKAREWMREAQAGDNYFSECVIEDAKQCASLIGIRIDDVYWSGFSSQGDGACFTGRWSADDVQPGKLAEHAPQDKELHRIAAEFERLAKEYPEASFTVRHSGHYSHKGCTDFSFSFDDEREEVGEAEDALTEASRDLMDWIYGRLEKEYEYVNSDEQIVESIRANEYDFTEDGSRNFAL